VVPENDAMGPRTQITNRLKFVASDDILLEYRSQAVNVHKLLTIRYLHPERCSLHTELQTSLYGNIKQFEL